jgi:hypothetical protein
MVRWVVASVGGAIIAWRVFKGWWAAGQLATMAGLVLGLSLVWLSHLHAFDFVMWELSGLAMVVIYWHALAKRTPYPAGLVAHWQEQPRSTPHGIAG